MRPLHKTKANLKSGRTESRMKSVMVGMSGGVDSSVAAILLQQKGYDVCGATLKLHDDGLDNSETESQSCCSLNDVLDARNVCDSLGIKHYVFNFKQHFEDDVIKRFVNEYLNGYTPNPCIECNKHIKFEKMLERAELLGCDSIATGHYAVTGFDERSGRWFLKKPADLSKDQTYVLYGMTQHQLEHTLFPLGGLTKPEVRQIASENNFINASKPDSQDICFVPDNDYISFIENYTGSPIEKGTILDDRGKVLGSCRGAAAFTIGQRKGLGVALGSPKFVISKDIKNNTVTLGEEDKLFSKTAIVSDCNFISVESLTEPMRVAVKVRYRQTEQPATIIPLDNGEVKVEFDEPQRAISPGQAAVFYNGDYVVGGGTIR